jgi:hypothetical protein
LCHYLKNPNTNNQTLMVVALRNTGKYRDVDAQRNQYGFLEKVEGMF